LPIANTWTEELIAEWLHLDGFLVEIGLPAAGSGRGGRREADVVGGRVNSGKLQVCHCEAAEWLIDRSATEVATQYQNKFSKDVTDSVGRYLCTIFGTKEIGSYQKLVVTKYFAKEFPKELSQVLPDAEAILLDDLIKNRIMPSIKNWKLHHETAKGNPPQLPRALWLLKMIEFCMEWGLNFKS
jgi:hypothetical protein